MSGSNGQAPGDLRVAAVVEARKAVAAAAVGLHQTLASIGLDRSDEAWAAADALEKAWAQIGGVVASIERSTKCSHAVASDCPHYT